MSVRATWQKFKLIVFLENLTILSAYFFVMPNLIGF
jgi:hypothetical protein